KKTIGKKNADFQATRFNVNGQPYYVLLDNEEKLLTEPRGFDLNVEAFIQFLDKGVEEFKKRNQ
ncbi:MAG TPA: thiol:disulfide interchange protein, partial [Tenuifilum sp.]|nr:thiol:disulfide interchange protein [Tenuifilum sp.]